MSTRGLAAGGAVLVLLAVSPLLEVPATRSFAWHMVQHQVLVLAAAPLLGLALARRAGHRARGLAHGGVTVAAGVVHAATVLAWHVPSAYDAATAAVPVHGLEHVTLLGTAVLLWAAVAATHDRANHPGGAVGALVLVGLVSAGLGVVLLMASEPLYAAYATAPRALVDQQVGGALMKVAGLAVHAAAAVGLTVSWLQGLAARA